MGYDLAGTRAWNPWALKRKTAWNPWAVRGKPAWRNAWGIVLFVQLPCSCFWRNVTTQPFAVRGIDFPSGGMPDLPFTYGDLLFGGSEIFLLACGGDKI